VLANHLSKWLGVQIGLQEPPHAGLGHLLVPGQLFASFLMIMDRFEPSHCQFSCLCKLTMFDHHCNIARTLSCLHTTS